MAANMHTEKNTFLLSANDLIFEKKATEYHVQIDEGDLLEESMTKEVFLYAQTMKIK